MEHPSVLKLFREPSWALDLGLSHGLLLAARRGALAPFCRRYRRGALATLSQVQARARQPGARAQLAAALSSDEFRCLEALLTSTGRTSNDVSSQTWQRCRHC